MQLLYLIHVFMARKSVPYERNLQNSAVLSSPVAVALEGYVTISCSLLLKYGFLSK